MSHSIISFRGKYINVKDSVFAAWLFYAAAELSNANISEEWTKELHSKWTYEAHLAGGGILSGGFDDYLTDENRLALARAIADKVLARFISFGTSIPVSELNSMQMSGTRWTRDVDIAHFTRVAKGVVNLLSHNMQPEEQSLPVQNFPVV
jgi:hypothetical protein